MLLAQALAFYKNHAAIIANIVFLLFEKAVAVGLVFFCEGVISHLLGISLYGKWLYSINLTILFSSFALIAGSEVVVPALVRHPRLHWKILTSVFILRFSSAFLAFFIGIFYAFFFVEDQDIKLMLTLLTCAVIFNEPFSVIANFYQAQTKIGVVVAFRLSVLLLRVLLVFIALSISSTLVIYSTRVMEALFLAIALCFLIISRGGIWDWDKTVSLIMLKRGIMLWIPLILMLIYMRLDRLFVEYYLGFEELATYGVANQILEQAVLIISIVVQSIAPIMLYGRKVKSIRTVILYILLFTFFLQLLGWVWLGDIILLIFGQHYQPAAALAKMMLPALSFMAVDSILMQRLYRDGKYILILFKWSFLSIVSFFNYWVLLSVFRSGEIYIVYVFNALLMMITTILLCFTYTYSGQCVRGLNDYNSNTDL